MISIDYNDSYLLIQNLGLGTCNIILIVIFEIFYA